jgi:hypothetical protein
VVVKGNLYGISIHPKELAQQIVHKIEREYSMNLPGRWHARVVEGTGDICKYQERYVVMLFPANQRTLEVIRNPRTAKGSTLQIGFDNTSYPPAGLSSPNIASTLPLMPVLMF